MYKKGFIEQFGLFASLSVSMIGSGVFYAPAIISKYVGQNSWIVSIASAVIVFFIFWAIVKLFRINSYKTITDILKGTYGSIIGSLLALLYSILIIIISALFLRNFSEVISMYLLPNTPREVVLITLIFIAMYLSRGGLANVVHFNEIIFWIMFIPIGIILLLVLPEADFSNLLPIGGYGVINYARGSFEMLFLLSGFSIVFTLVPYVREKKRTTGVLLKNSIFTGVFYTAILILVCATLSSAQVKESIFPTITMLESVSSRSGILEKWDSLIMALWVIFFFTSFANMYYFSSVTLKDVLHIKNIRTASAVYVPLVYLAAIIPENIIEIRNVKYGYLRTGSIAVIVVIIGVTLVLSILKRGRRHGNEKQNN